MDKVKWTAILNAHLEKLAYREHAQIVASAETDRIAEKEYYEEMEKKDKAFNAAKKRYKNLSFFGKLANFKKRPNNIDYEKLSVEEIQQLYRKR